MTYDRGTKKCYEEARELRAKTGAAKSSGKSKDSLSNQEPTAYLIPVVAEDRALPL